MVKGYEINMELPLEEGIRGVILGCISYMQDQITNRQEIQGPVHETRRSIKRIRAILRMIRDETGYSNYHRENVFYRDLSRRMSPLRDHHVLLRTLQDFGHKSPETFSEKETSVIIQVLEHRIREEEERFMDLHGGFDRMLEDIEEAGTRVEEYCRLRDGFVSVRKGIRRIYGRGSRDLGLIRDTSSETNFHEYRKNTKYLHHQMELVSPVFPKLIKAYGRTIDKHAELLGDARDYGRLESFILEGGGWMKPNAARRRMAHELGSRKQELMEIIYVQAGRIYAEKPSDFITRLGTYWNTGIPG